MRDEIVGSNAAPQLSDQLSEEFAVGRSQQDVVHHYLAQAFAEVHTVEEAPVNLSGATDSLCEVRDVGMPTITPAQIIHGVFGREVCGSLFGPGQPVDRGLITEDFVSRPWRRAKELLCWRSVVFSQLPADSVPRPGNRPQWFRIKGQPVNFFPSQFQVPRCTVRIRRIEQKANAALARLFDGRQGEFGEDPAPLVVGVRNGIDRLGDVERFTTASQPPPHKCPHADDATVALGEQ